MQTRDDRWGSYVPSETVRILNGEFEIDPSPLEVGDAQPFASIIIGDLGAVLFIRRPQENEYVCNLALAERIGGKWYSPNSWGGGTWFRPPFHRGWKGNPVLWAGGVTVDQPSDGGDRTAIWYGMASDEVSRLEIQDIEGNVFGGVPVSEESGVFMISGPRGLGRAMVAVGNDGQVLRDASGKLIALGLR